MAAAVRPRPSLLVLAGNEASATLQDLFGRRGFVVTRTVSRDAEPPDACVLDFHLPHAVRAAERLRAYHPDIVIVGIADEDGLADVQGLVDAAFAPPVDRARLFVRVVELVAARKKGHPAAKITGIVGVIRGNALFTQTVALLHRAVPPVNAGAVLDRALHDVEATAATVDEADLAALLASGRLGEALAPFGDPKVIHATLATLGEWLRARAGQADPRITVRSDAAVAARTCG